MCSCDRVTNRPLTPYRESVLTVTVETAKRHTAGHAWRSKYWRPHDLPEYSGERFCDRAVRLMSSFDNKRPAAELGVVIKSFQSNLGTEPEEDFSDYDAYTTSRAFVPESIASSQPGPAGSLFIDG